MSILDRQWIMLDDKSKRCFLLGVNDESKAYNFFYPVNKRIIINKDVIFKQQNNWNWEKNDDYVSDIEKQLEHNEVENLDQQGVEIRDGKGALARMPTIKCGGRVEILSLLTHITLNPYRPRTKRVGLFARILLNPNFCCWHLSFFM